MSTYNKLIISIQYGLTRALARQLQAEAEKIKSNSDGKLASIKADIYGVWRGENADRYLQKMDMLGIKMTDNAKGIEDSARLIDQMAVNIYRAELQAIEIAKKRG